VDLAEFYRQAEPQIPQLYRAKVTKSHIVHAYRVNFFTWHVYGHGVDFLYSDDFSDEYELVSVRPLYEMHTIDTQGR
jgi:hypothetical protein